MAIRIGTTVIAVTHGRLLVRRARYKILAVLWAKDPAMMLSGYAPRTREVSLSEL